MELALTPDSRWGLDAPALAGVAKRAGFAAVGLGVPLADEAAAAALTASGVRCHELLALVLGRDDDANLRQAQALAAGADAVGAEWVLTTFAVPLTSDSAKAMARYAAMFAEAGAKMAAEFSPLGKVTSIPGRAGGGRGRRGGAGGRDDRHLALLPRRQHVGGPGDRAARADRLRPVRRRTRACVGRRAWTRP